MEKTIVGLSMEEFKLEIEKLNSEGLKFNVESHGWNIGLSLSQCDISVYHAHEFCGEITITKPNTDVKFVIDYDAIEILYKDDNDIDVKYYVQMEEDMRMSDIQISISE